MSILKNSILYSMSSVILKGVNFLLLPFYLRIFTKEEYGLLDLGISLSWLLGALFSLGFPQVVYVNYVHQTKNERVKLLLDLTKSYLLISIILILVFLLATSTSSLFPYEIKLSILALSFLTYFQLTYFNLLKIEDKALKLATVQTILGIVAVLINVLFIFVFNCRIIVLFLSQVFTLTISTVLFSKHLNKAIKSESITFFENDFLKNTKKYVAESLTLLGGYVSYFLQNQLDKWIVFVLLSVSSVGVYSVSTKISGLFTLVVTHSIIAAYIPKLLNRYKNENVKDVESYSRKKSYLVIITGVFLVLICWLFLKSLYVNFVGENYKDSFEPAMILLFGQFLLLSLQMRGVFLVYKKKFKIQTTGLVLSLILNLILNLILVPKYSILGASISTTISYLFSFIYVELFCLKLQKQLITN